MDKVGLENLSFIQNQILIKPEWVFETWKDLSNKELNKYKLFLSKSFKICSSGFDDISQKSKVRLKLKVVFIQIFSIQIIPLIK